MIITICVIRCLKRLSTGYNVTVRDYDKDDFDGDKYHNTKNGFNADIGAYTDLNDNWTVGLFAQNIIPRSADISNDKAGEKPARRKTKGSCPTLIGAG